jgi:heme/copper-type cytochrome/quinol oxidase subunit 2
LLGVVVGVVVTVLVIFVFNGPRDSTTETPVSSDQSGPITILGEDAFRPDNAAALSTVEGGTREELKENLKVPEVGATSTPAEIAVPKSSAVVEGASGSAAIRTFEITADNKTYTPSTIVVNEMDIITIELTSVDDDYNILFPDFGVYRQAAKGTTSKFQFQAYPFGDYEFYCEGCGGMSGRLVVNKPE